MVGESGARDYPNIAKGNGHQGFLKSNVTPVKLNKRGDYLSAFVERHNFTLLFRMVMDLE